MTPPNFLNLPQYHVHAVEEDAHAYHMYVQPANATMVCRHCGSVRVAKWGGSEIVVRDLPAQGKRVSLYIRAQRLRCEDCDRTPFEPLPALAGGRRMTRRLVSWITAQSVRRVFASIAEETGVDEKTIRNIFHDYSRELDASTTFETPRWLGIDDPRATRTRCRAARVACAETAPRPHARPLAAGPRRSRQRRQLRSSRSRPRGRTGAARFSPISTIIVEETAITLLARSMMWSFDR